MSANPYSNISSDALREAAEIRDQIDSLEARLESILGGGGSVAAPPKRRGRPPGSGSAAASGGAPVKRKKRKISPEGLERIRAAQRKRWAKQKRG